MGDPPNTIPPDLNAKIPVNFWIEFELLEKALPGSVKIKFSRTGGRKDNQGQDDSVDATAERVITFGTAFEAPGVHIVQLNALQLVDNGTYPVALGSGGSVSPQVDLTDGTVYDVTLQYNDNANNPTSSVVNNFVEFDSTHPTLVSSTIDFGVGIIVVEFSELIDMTLSDFRVGGLVRIADVGKVDLSKFGFGEASGSMKFDLSQSDAYNLTASRISADIDARKVKFILTELQRVTLIQLSADESSGGDADNSPVVLDLSELAIRDLASNINNFGSIALIEKPDNIKPNISSATINLEQPAVLIIRSNEILDSTPASQVDASSLRLSNDPGDSENGAVTLEGSTVTNGGMGVPYPGTLGAGPPFEIIDDYVVKVTLTEAQRARAIAISATQGGNGYQGRIYTPRSCKDANNQDVGDPSSEAACTGLTGNSYTAATCVGGSAAADPYIYDDEGDICTTGGGVYTGSSCDNSGDFSSESACEGPGATGYVWAEAVCSDINGPNADGEITPTRHTCLGAMVLDIIGVAALRDIAQNQVGIILGVPVTETGDATSPTVVSAEIKLGNGELILTCNEYIDVTPAITKVDLTKIHLGDSSGGNEVLANLAGAANVTEIDGYKVTITLSEAQRVHAIEHSGQPGGDGKAIFCDVDEGALKDIAQNNNLDTDTTGLPGLNVSESPDLIRPTIKSISLTLATGILTITASETVDVSNANLTRLFLSNSIGENTIRLQGDPPLHYDNLKASVTSGDGVTFNITLTELQRVRAIENSGTNGGDGGPMVFDAPIAGGFTDIAQNDNLPQNGLPLLEIQDDIPPVLVSASLNYSNGVLTIQGTETIDSTPSHNIVSETDIYQLIVLSSIHLAEATGNKTISLTGANNVVELDRQQITVVLSEAQRAAAVVSSGMNPGGDGSALVLDCEAGAVRDVAGNLNHDNLNLSIVEFPDVVLPTVNSATLNLSDGTLIVETSETLDLTPSSSEIDLDLLYLANTPLNMHDRIVLSGAKPVESDSVFVTLILTEEQRVRAIQTSSTQGGDGIPITLEGDADALNDLSANNNLAFDRKTVAETLDSIVPTLISATLNYSTGILVIFASETIDANASNHPDTFGNEIVFVENIRISQITGNDKAMPGLNDVVLTGAGVTESEIPSVTIKLTEQQRVHAIAISGTPGGDGTPVVLDVFPNAVQDIAQNANTNSTANRNLTVTEVQDTIPPTILSSTLNLSTGILTLTADEYIDATPQSNFDLDKIRICDKSGVYTVAVDNNLPCIHIVNAKVTEIDDYTIFIKITERQRADAIAMSATPGGDGTPLVLDVLSGALQDVGTVRNLHNANISIDETPDTIPPELISCKIDYNTGYVQINSSEILDLTPSSSKVDLTKLKLVNSTGDDTTSSISIFPDFGPPSNNAVNLVGSNISDADNAYIELHIPELARSLANQFGGGRSDGDGGAALLDAPEGALLDVAGNDNVLLNGLVCEEVVDLRRPTLTSGVVNFSTGVMILTFDETIDISPSSLIDFNKIFLVDAALGYSAVGDLTELPAPSHFSLSGSQLQNDNDAVTVTMKMTELARVTAILFSSTKGNNGDNTKIHVRVDSQFAEDVGTNHNSAQSPIELTEIEDSVVPVVQSATLDYNNGTLILKCSETIDSTPTEKINTAKIFISDLDGEFLISLRGATVLQSSDFMDKNLVTIILTEAQRIGALELSSVIGDTTGDGTAVVVDIHADALKDVATNGVLEQTGISVTETQDSTRPTVLSATLSYIDVHPPGRVLKVVCSETIDTSLIVVSNIFIVNEAGDTALDRRISLSGASVVQTNDQTTFTIIITETQRVFALKLSGTPGGDNASVYLDFDAGGIYDIGMNPNLAVQGVPVQETPDTNPPRVISASITLGNGYISLVHSETVDALPKDNLDLGKVSLVQAASDSLTGGTGPGTIGSAQIENLIGATTVNGESDTILIQLSENQRDRAIRASATPGGDGTGFIFTPASCSGGSQDANPYTRDADGNICTSSGGIFSYSEPQCLGGLAASDPYFADADGSICTDLNGIYIEARAICTGGTADAHPYIDDQDGTLCRALNGTFTPSKCVDTDGVDQGNAAASSSAACTGSIILEVAQSAIEDMGLNDLDQSLGIIVHETPDTTKMSPTQASVDLNDGLLTIKFSENVRTYVGQGQSGTILFDLTKVDMTQPSNDSGFALTTGVEAVAEGNPNMIISEFSLYSFNLAFAESVSNIDLSNTVNIQLSEKQRALALQLSDCPSGNYDNLLGATGSNPLPGYNNGDATFGGDGSQLRLHFADSAFTDVALTGNSEYFDLLVDTVCDTTQPVFTAAEIHYGLGYVRLFFSETVDITPNALFDLSNIYIVDETGDRAEPDAVGLQGAYFNTTDDANLIFLTLTESQRISALLISGTPGGDGTSGKIDAASPLMRDLAGNLNPSDTMLNLSIYEIPDEVSPSIKSVIIDYNTGHIQIHLSEKILEQFWHMGNFSISSTREVNPDTATILTNIRLSDEHTSAFVSAVYASDVSVTADQRSAHINLTLSESQRVRAIAISNTPGGDGTGFIFTPSTCDNNAAFDSNQTACEEGQGNFTSNSCVDENGNTAGDSTNKATCEGEAAYFQAPMFPSKLGDWQTGAGFTDVSGNPNLKFPSITGYKWTDSSCSIPEYNRDKYKCLASAYGGVGTFVDSRCDDENGNPIRSDGKGIAASITLCEGDRSEAANAPMTEIGDTTRPIILEAVLDFNAVHPNVGASNMLLQHQSTLTIRHSEYIDQSPNHRITNGFIQGVYEIREDSDPGTVPNFGDISQTRVVDVAAHGGSYLPEASGIDHAPSFIGDGYEIKFNLTEAQRVRLIQMSNTSGGDGSVLQLRVPDNTYTDVAQNDNIGVDALIISEIADTTGPSILTCSVNLTDGMLTISAAEYIDADPTTNVDTSKAFLANTSGITGYTWIPATESFCSDGTSGGAEIDCTGLTGAKFHPAISSRCSNNAAFDFNQTSCESGGGIFYPNVPNQCSTCDNSGDPSSLETCTGLTGYTYSEGPPSTCTDYRGAAAGSAANEVACEGTSNSNTYLANDPAMDATSLLLCEGAGTGHTYTAASSNMCKDLAGNDVIGAYSTKATCEGSHLEGQPSSENGWTGASLQGARIFASEGTIFSVQLTEVQRVRAIRISALVTSGGDGLNAVMLEAEPGFVQDIAENMNKPLSSLICSEVVDSLAPVILSVELFLQVGSVEDGLNYGKVRMNTSETVYSSSVNVSRIVFENDVGPAEEYALDRDGGATVMTQPTEDGYMIELKLTELQRVHLIALSGTPGGDTRALSMKLMPFALTDVALNGNELQENVTVIEYADTIPPKMIACDLVFDIGDGTANLTISFDETIDVMLGSCSNDPSFNNDPASCTGTWNETSGILLSRLFLVNTSDATGISKVSLVGATIHSLSDGFSVTLSLTEVQRTLAIAFNGFVNPGGGDGTPVQLNVEEGTFVDVARNHIVAQIGFVVEETKDTRNPVTTHARLNLGTGILSVTSDEFIDLTPLTIIDASKMALIDDVSDAAGVLAAFDDPVTGALAVGSGAAYESFSTVLLDRNTTVLAAPGSICSGIATLGLSEQDCTGLTGNSWTSPKCDGVEYSVDTGITGDDAYDGKECTDNGGIYTAPLCTNNGNAESKQKCEGIRLGTCVATSGGSNADCSAATTAAECDAATISGGATCDFTPHVFTPGPDGYVLTAKLSEVQRVRAITLSNSSGGVHTPNIAQFLRMAEGVYRDVAQNSNAALVLHSSVLLVQEISDTILPDILSAEIHYGEFWLKVRFSETIDTTPSSAVNLEKLFLSENTDGKQVSLNAAGVTVTENDQLTVTINLVESVRISGMYYSAGSGGDGKNTSTVLTVEPGAFSDIALNRNGPSVLNFPMFEHEDVDPPQLLSAVINYSTGILRITSQETLAIGSKPELQLLDRYHLRDVSDNISEENTVTLGGPDGEFNLDPELSGQRTVILNPHEDSLTLTLLLTESQRVRALAFSNTPGGNGNSNFSFTPSSCSPASQFNSDEENCRNSGSIFTSSSCKDLDGNEVGSNSSRVDCEGVTAFDVDAGATADVRGNLGEAFSDIYLLEIPDTIIPVLINGSIDLNDGILSILASEVIDVTPADQSNIDVSKIRLSNVDGEPLEISLVGSRVAARPSSCRVKLGGTNLNCKKGNKLNEVTCLGYSYGSCSVISGGNNVHCDSVNTSAECLAASSLGDTCEFTEDSDNSCEYTPEPIIPKDGLTFHLQLTEMQRISAIESSSSVSNGGDGRAMLLDFLQGAVKDVGTNGNDLQIGLNLVEIPDTTPPFVMSAKIDYSTGILVITCNERIDSTPSDIPGGKIDLSKLNIANAVGTGGVVKTGNTFTPSSCSNNPQHDGNQTACVSGSGIYTPSTCATCSNGGDSTSQLACEGPTSGLTGNSFTPSSCSNNVHLNDDRIACEHDSNPGVGVWVPSSCSNGGDATSESTCTGIRTNNVYSATGGNASSKTACEGANEGRGSAALLEGATILEVDSVNVTLVLPMATRALGIQMSNTPGGDNPSANPTLLRIEEGALLDIAQVDVIANEDPGIELEETADTIIPVVLRGAISYGDGILTLTADEWIDADPKSNVRLNKMWISDISASKDISLAGASIQRSTEGYTVTVILTEHQRTEAIRISSQIGGNGDPILVDLDGGALQDIGTRPNAIQYGVNISETADIIKPSFSAASIDFNNGSLVFKASEVIDLEPLTNLNLSRFFLSDTTAAALSNLTGNEGLYGRHDRVHLAQSQFIAQSQDLLSITIMLTEAQRTKALYLSSQPGNIQEAEGSGNNLPLKLEILDSAIRDVAQNLNDDLLDSNVDGGTDLFLEVPDTTKPFVANVTLFLNVQPCNLKIVTSETIRVETTSSLGEFKVDLTKIFLVNGTSHSGLDPATGLPISGCRTASSICVPLAGDDKDDDQLNYKNGFTGLFVSDDSHDGRGGLHFNVTLSEMQRSKAIAMSSTFGGDGIATVLDIAAGAFFDRAGNPNPLQENIFVKEQGDDVKPQISLVTLRLGDGVLRLNLSEICDLTPALKYVNISKMFLTNKSYAEDNGTRGSIWLDGARITNETIWDRGAPTPLLSDDGKTHKTHDDMVLFLELTEVQRARAIELSGTEGGDGGALLFNVKANAFRDIAQNKNDEQLGIPVTEIEDDTSPVMTKVVIDYGTSSNVGLVTISASETLDVTPASQIDLTKIEIRDTFTVPAENPSQVLTLMGTNSGTAEVDPAVDSLNITIRLTEEQRARSILMSTTSGGIICTEGFNSAFHNDASGCTSRGRCSVKLGGNNNECAKYSPGTESQCAAASSANGGNLSNGCDFTRFEFHNSSAIVRSVAGSLTDLAQTKSSLNTSLYATEKGDVQRPRVISGSIDFNNGDLSIFADEVLDLFDSSLSIIPAKISLRNSTEATQDAISLDGVHWVFGLSSACITPNLTLTSAAPHLGLGFTIRLTEAMRVGAIQRSNTPGGTERFARGASGGGHGDGSAISLDLAVGAVRDLAGNPNVQLGAGGDAVVVLEEIPDRTAPKILSGLVNLDTRVLSLTFSETIDVTPSSLVIVNKLFFGNRAGIKDATLNIGSGQGLLLNADAHETLQPRPPDIHPDSTVVNFTFGDPLKLAITKISSLPGGDCLDGSGNQGSCNTYHASICSDGTIGGQPSDCSDGIFTPAQCSTCSNDGDTSKSCLGCDSSSELACTGLTGNVFTEGTPNSCTNGGNATSRESCEGPGSTGRVFSANGGDSSSQANCEEKLILDFEAGAVLDIAGNENTEQLGVVLEEFPDVSPPVLVRVYAHLGEGYIHLFFDETIDLEPISKLNLSAMFLNNNPGDHFLQLSDYGVPFDDDISAPRKCVGSNNSDANPYIEDDDGILCKNDGGQYLSSDVIVSGTSINISLTEHQRVSVIEKSSTPGGDGSRLTFDLFPNAVHDIGVLHNEIFLGFFVIEVPDIIPPVLEKALIDYNDGTLIIRSTEIVDLTPIISMCSNGGDVTSLLTCSGLTGNTFLPGSCSVVNGGVNNDCVSASLDEALCLGMSKGACEVRSGGNNSNCQLAMNHEACTQAGDDCEFRPTPSEACVYTPKSCIGPIGGESECKLTISSNVYTPPKCEGSSIYDANPYVGDPIVCTDDGGIFTPASCLGPPGSEANQSFCEGTNNGNVFVGPGKVDPSKIIFREQNNTDPANDIVGRGGVLDANTFLPKFNISGANISQFNTVDALAITIVLTESQRVKAIEMSGTPGSLSKTGVGNYSAVLEIEEDLVVDIAQTGNARTTLNLVEKADSTDPRITNAAINYSTGIIRLEFSETIDANPLSLVNLSKLYIADSSSGTDIVLDYFVGGYFGGSGVTTIPSGPQQETTLELQLSEAHRAQAIQLSGVPGNDANSYTAGPARFRVHDTNALVDIATNDIDPTSPASVNGFIMLEAADIVPPSLNASEFELDLNDGTCTITVTETIDIRSSDDSGANQVFDFTKLSLSQSGGDFKGLNSNVFTPGSCSVMVGGNNDLCSEAHSEEECSDATIAGNSGNNANDCVWTHNTCRLAGGSTVSSSGTGASANELACRYGIEGHNPQLAIPLYGSQSHVRNVGNLVYPRISFTLTEADRVAAIEKSQNIAKGGDGVALVFDALAGAFTDLGGNPSAETLGMIVNETEDTTPIVPLSARIDYSTGVVVITASEYFHKSLNFNNFDLSKISISDDVTSGTSAEAFVSTSPQISGNLDLRSRLGNIFTPSSCSNNNEFDDIQAMCVADLSPGVGIFVPASCNQSDGTTLNRNGTGLAERKSSCIGAELTSVLKNKFAFRLSEEQRSMAITISKTLGGDSTGNIYSPATCQTVPGLGVNNACASSNSNASYCLSKSKGTCTKETGSTNANCDLATDAASCTYAGSDCEFTVDPTRACEFVDSSCSNGGDSTSIDNCEGTGAVLLISPGALTDVANNRNDQAFAIRFEEIPDSLKPKVVRAHVDFSLSTLTITFDEVIDLSPLATKVKLSHVLLTQSDNGLFNALPNAVRMSTIGDNTYYNGTVVNYTHEEMATGVDALTYTLKLTEPQRVAVMRIK